MYTRKRCKPQTTRALFTTFFFNFALVNNTPHIVAFTGHRTYDHSADELLATTIRHLYAEGARHFRVGMAEGFDLAAGRAVVDMMLSHSDIILEACIPWPSFASHFAAEERATYDTILGHATIVRYSDDAYHPAIFRHRNNMLVDGADVVVAWWSGATGGTAYTIKRAKAAHCPIVNLYPDEQLALDFSK